MCNTFQTYIYIMFRRGTCEKKTNKRDLRFSQVTRPNGVYLVDAIESKLYTLTSYLNLACRSLSKGLYGF